MKMELAEILSKESSIWNMGKAIITKSILGLSRFKLYSLAHYLYFPYSIKKRGEALTPRLTESTA
jgi:hypothetical protein